MAGAYSLDSLARDGVEVGKQSSFAKLVPAAEVETTAYTQYSQMLKQASEKTPWHPTTTRRWFACAPLP